MRKTERNGENWFIGHLQRPNGNRQEIDHDDDDDDDVKVVKLFPFQENIKNTTLA